MNFDIKILRVLDIGGVELWITETIVNSWIIMGLLIAFAVVVRISLRKFRDEPKGLQNVVEAMVEAFDSFLKGSAGDKLQFLGGWYFMVFAFILLSNLSGLFGLRPPTADWTITFTFALATFTLIQVVGIKYQRGKYFKSFIEPHFLFLPLNIIGELARPVSLSFRLFGNVLGGMILMNLLYAMAPAFVLFIIPSALHFYFDVFAGVLQTYIFCVLSLSFIGVAAQVE